ncbi:nucleoside triphosphate hydrolase [Celeribacter arenosi]|uniref:Nucleoside/nucleotide kinase family protein n=1 Tax=Celeribacter arenosi TaxID=792649 RepID=A0ABP7K4C6_9RHOB
MISDDLVSRIAALPHGGAGRVLVALAGAPGSGKSTLADELAARTGGRVVPMDGFHLDNRILDARGLRARKGAPETFDAAGFTAMITRLKAGGEVAIPTFDRTRDIAIAGAEMITPQDRLLIVEGNYLLFDHPDWRGLADLWDFSIRLDVPRAVLRERLVTRWRTFGLGEEAAIQRAEGNDLANADAISAATLPADLVLRG